MLLVYAAALGLAGGLLTGGSIANLTQRRLRWPLVVVAAFAIKELLLHTPAGYWAIGPVIFGASLAILIAWTAWHYRVLPGIVLVSVGMALNLLVVIANGGHMPVTEAAAYLGPSQLLQHGAWGQYVLMGDDTRLSLLGDWILLPQPLARIAPQAYSAGDLVSSAGLLLALLWGTRPMSAGVAERATSSR